MSYTTAERKGRPIGSWWETGTLKQKWKTCSHVSVIYNPKIITQGRDKETLLPRTCPTSCKVRSKGRNSLLTALQISWPWRDEGGACVGDRVLLSPENTVV